MLNGMYHEERTYKGMKIVIDLAEIESGKFEVMTMTAKDAEEIESYTSRSLSEVVEAYNNMLTKYPDGEQLLKGKYITLKVDLMEAIKAGKAAEKLSGADDNGTCNFDAVIISLPRWQESKILQAAKEAGTHASKRTNGYIFQPVTSAQSKPRTINARAMAENLKAAGYNASVYYVLD